MNRIHAINTTGLVFLSAQETSCAVGTDKDLPYIHKSPSFITRSFNIIYKGHSSMILLIDAYSISFKGEVLKCNQQIVIIYLEGLFTLNWCYNCGFLTAFCFLTHVAEHIYHIMQLTS